MTIHVVILSRDYNVTHIYPEHLNTRRSITSQKRLLTHPNDTQAFKGRYTPFLLISALQCAHQPQAFFHKTRHDTLTELQQD